MTRHPSDLEVLEACENRPNTESTREHLDSGCLRCARRAAAWRTVLSALHAPILSEPPREWLFAALSRIRELGAAEPEVAVGERSEGEVTQRLREAARNGRRLLESARAALVLDTSLGAALHGIRGQSALGPRQLHYGSRLGHVHLQIDPEPRRKLAIRGQFLPAEGTLAESARAVLEREGVETTRPLSPTGEFRFRGVAAGRVRLRVEWSHHRIDLDPLELAPDDA